MDAADLSRSSAEGGPFRIPPVFHDPLRRTLLALAQPALERVLAFPTLNSMYAEAAQLGDAPFCDRALQRLAIDYLVSDAALTRIPTAGPLVVVSNHPFGALDGLILTSLLRRIRPDVKFLGNYLLALVPDYRESIFFVDPFGGPDAPARNVAAMKAALRWVRDGGCLAVFPAGEVSHLDVTRTRVIDPVWSPSVGRFVRRAGAAVTPVFFEGANSALFQMAGLVHARLRTMLLPRELLRKQRTPVTVRIGPAVAPARLAQFQEDEAATSYLRARTYLLRGPSPDWRAHPAVRAITQKAAVFVAPLRGAEGAEEPGSRPATRPRRRGVPVSAAAPVATVRREIEALPASQQLCESGPLVVCYAHASQAPAVLHELGRLRELTFREAGEGTGKAIDLDRFDEHYLHLCLWNREREELVGAYRLGLTDAILPKLGPEGLYTHTLFRYDARLLAHLTPAIELGRSFVRLAYQKEYGSLMLLWKGIGRFVAEQPKYRRLFGPVSISNEYRSLSRELLMAFLEANRLLPDLARLVSPRHPPRLARRRDREPVMAGRLVTDLDEVDALVADIEANQKGVPVLLRQYLRLNARLLGFNIDPRFGHVLDGLMLVDLMDVPRAVLVRYMGREAADRFAARHTPPS